jgi:hypothetical protein
MTTQPTQRPDRAPIGSQLLVLVAGILVTLAGMWIFASPLAGAVADVTGLPRWLSSLGFMTIWFGLVFVAVIVLSRREPQFRIPFWVGFVLPALATGAVFAYTHLVDKTVNDNLDSATVKASDLGTAQGGDLPETVEDGLENGADVEKTEPPPANVELATGSFEGIGHHAEGEIQVIQLAEGGRRLQLKNVDIENAPDLHVYLAEERVEGDVGEYEYLAKLKGNKGNQQYKLPDDLDLKKNGVVVVWCRAFDVGVAQAPLKAS